MTAESVTTLAAADVLAAAKRFFAGSHAVHPAWIDTESPTHISFATFRSNVVVSAVPASEAESGTRVRVSSLRDAGAVSRFLAYLESLPAGSVPGGRTVPSGGV